MDMARGYGKVVFEYHLEGEEPGTHVAKRDIAGGDPEQVMLLRDSDQMRAMEHAEANRLASRAADTYSERLKIWEKQAKKGRTPGASSRPKKLAKQTSS